ncbi:MAG: hypothetical protein ABIJ72_03065 [bacterium]
MRDFPAVIRPVVEILGKSDINIVQMPCPELFFDKLIRRPKQKSAYADAKCQSNYRQVADSVVKQVEMYLANGYKVIAIMGIEFSPSCAVNVITGPPPNRIRSGTGFFMEALSHSLRAKGIAIPMIGIKTRSPAEAVEELTAILRR